MDKLRTCPETGEEFLMDHFGNEVRAELDRDEIRDTIFVESITAAELISKAENAKVYFSEVQIIEMLEENFMHDLAERLYQAEKDNAFLRKIITEYCDKLQAIINKPLNQ